jgi:hypothetical protein
VGATGGAAGAAGAAGDCVLFIPSAAAVVVAEFSVFTFSIGFAAIAACLSPKLSRFSQSIED